MSADEITARANRILDAAAAMLLQHGYRKVTVDDIAARAKVGKGTIYLHWRTKAHLFETLLRREFIGLIKQLVDNIREDPAEAMPHRFARASFVVTMRSPLLAALITGNSDILGDFADTALRGKELLASDEYFDLLIRHGLLRDDIPNLAYAFHAASIGFWLYDSAEPEDPALDTEARADALATLVRHAFEPATPPEPAALTAAAHRLCAIFEDLIAAYHKSLPPNATQSSGE